ncbi:DUF1036 domain-containing protein [Parvibaculum sp.]|uniref:DUF1036 domain-containing protein n=1 Tax=Parvibaculum sp. TaxID=2024848 RepID=UPI002CEA4948|nr:DUF1036 domain-containing protein [Parvibaculum sp.]HUD50671.1 DUF1036 domain-containing protein [Parvibaculum sp.]
MRGAGQCLFLKPSPLEGEGWEGGRRRARKKKESSEEAPPPGTLRVPTSPSGGEVKVFACIALLCLLFLPSPAHADYKLCNATSYVLQGAVGLQGEAPATEWHSQGWTRVLPGSCASLLAGPVKTASYFVFARSMDVHQGPAKYFSGNERFCTIPKDFFITGRDNCALRGYESNEFIRVEARAGDDWTTTFGEPRNYSLDEARVAGVQRLLHDNGFRIAKIDGYAAKATLRSVMAFQRATGHEPTGEIDETLIGQLIAGAEEEQKRSGLNLCNKTNYLIWAAVGFRGPEDDMSSGWIRIEPSACVKAIKGKLTQPSYAIYAEAVDDKGQMARQDGRPLVWSGTESYCTKTTRFEIRGRDACVSRGYDEKRFMRVDTGGKPVFDVTLK